METDLEALRQFVAVAEELHFTRAAARLGISRATLSRSVVSLEEALGQELFVRPSTRTELTEAGRNLLARAAELLGDHAPGGGDPDAPVAGPSFRVAIMPGVTVGKWTRIWAERRPDLPLSVVRTDETTQLSVLLDDAADISFVRLPVDRAGLSVIPLYSEVQVVVVDREHVLTLLDEVSVLDLADEHLLQDPGAVPQGQEAAAGLPTGERPLPRGLADTIALVAAGVGVVVVPQSLARLHHRKDVTYRPVTDLDPTHVGLAWVADRTTPDVEEFVGIVRGRSARSSRTSAPPSADQGLPEQAGSADPRPDRAGSQKAGTQKAGTQKDGSQKNGSPAPPSRSGRRPSGGGRGQDVPGRAGGRPAGPKGRRGGKR